LAGKAPGILVVVSNLPLEIALILVPFFLYLAIKGVPGRKDWVIASGLPQKSFALHRINRKFGTS
jgi:hypothetical protein